MKTEAAWFDEVMNIYSDDQQLIKEVLSKEVMKNMEFLMKELHKEWERSGITKATVIIQQEEVEAVNQVLIKKIAVQQ